MLMRSLKTNADASQASGERLQLAGNDDGVGDFHRRIGGLGHEPGADDGATALDQCLQHDAGGDAAGARQRSVAANFLLGDFVRIQSGPNTITVAPTLTTFQGAQNTTVT